MKNLAASRLRLAANYRVAIHLVEPAVSATPKGSTITALGRTLRAHPGYPSKKENLDPNGVTEF